MTTRPEQGRRRSSDGHRRHRSHAPRDSSRSPPRKTRYREPALSRSSGRDTTHAQRKQRAAQRSEGRAHSSARGRRPQRERSDGLSEDSCSEWERSLDEASEAAFSFRQRVDRLDWRKIASVDVDSVIKERDFKTLEGNLVNLTFCNVELEQSPSLDGHFLKVMKLLQLMVECLLYAQKDLKEDAEQQKTRRREAEKKVADAEALLHKLEKKAAFHKQELKNRKENILMLQSLVQKDSDVQQCPYCPKQFVNPPLLHSHIERRHPQCAAAAIPRQPAAIPETTPPVRERSSPAHHQEKRDESAEQIAHLQEALQSLTTRLQENEDSVRSALQERETSLNQQHQQVLATISEQEQRKHQEHLQSVVLPLKSQIQQLLEAQKAQEEIALKSISSRKRTTNLGDIEDDDSDVQGQRADRREREREVQRLQQEHEDQEREIRDLKTAMQHQVATMQEQQNLQRGEWMTRMNQVEDRYRSELQQAREQALSQSLSSSQETEKLIARERKRLEKEQRQREEVYNHKARELAEQEVRLAHLRQHEESREVASKPHGERLQNPAERQRLPQTSALQADDHTVVPGRHSSQPSSAVPQQSQSESQSESEESDDSVIEAVPVVEQQVRPPRDSTVAHQQIVGSTKPANDSSAPRDRDQRRKEAESQANSVNDKATRQANKFRMPGNPLIKTRYNHVPAVVDQTRTEVLETIEVELRRLGVRNTAGGLKADDYEGRMESLRKSRQVQNVRQPALEEMREQVRHQLEDITNRGYSDWNELQQMKLNGVPISVQRPPLSPDKEQAARQRRAQKKPPALKPKAMAVLAAARPLGDKHKPPKTPQSAVSSSSGNKNTGSGSRSFPFPLPAGASTPATGSAKQRPNLAGSSITMGQPGPATKYSDSESPLSDDEEEEPVAQARPRIAQPSPPTAQPGRRAVAVSENDVYAKPEKPKGKSRVPAQPPKITAPSPGSQVSGAMTSQRPHQPQQQQPVPVAQTGQGSVHESSWDEESVSELNGLLHESVGTPAATLAKRDADISHYNQEEEDDRDTDDDDYDDEHDDERAGGTGNKMVAVHMQDAVVDDDDLPVHGTGRVKELAASLSSSMRMTPVRAPAGGVDLRTNVKASAKPSEFGIPAQEEDSFSLSSFDGDYDDNTKPQRSAGGAGAHDRAQALLTGNLASTAQSGTSTWKEGMASGRASLGAGSSIAMSSINVEDLSDLSDGDDW